MLFACRTPEPTLSASVASSRSGSGTRCFVPGSAALAACQARIAAWYSRSFWQLFCPASSWKSVNSWSRSSGALVPGVLLLLAAWPWLAPAVPACHQHGQSRLAGAWSGAEQTHN